MGNKGQEHRQTAFSCAGGALRRRTHILGGTLFPQHSLIATNTGVRSGDFQHPELSVSADLENP